MTLAEFMSAIHMLQSEYKEQYGDARLEVIKRQFQSYPRQLFQKVLTEAMWRSRRLPTVQELAAAAQLVREQEARRNNELNPTTDDIPWQKMPERVRAKLINKGLLK